MSNYMGDEKVGKFMKRKVVIIGGILLILGCIGFGVKQLFQKDDPLKDNNLAHEKNDSVKQDENSDENVLNDNESDDDSYSLFVPLQEEVDNSYFDDALFIGDSRTEGFMIYEDIRAISYTHKGLMVDTIFTSPVITLFFYRKI